MGFPPLSGRKLVRIKLQKVRLKTTCGTVEVEVPYGQDPETGQWLSPMRDLWGLGARQEMSPELEDRICWTASMVGSYEAAAQTANKWGVAMDDSTIHAHVCKVGRRAQEMECARVNRALEPSTRAEVVREAGEAFKGENFSLVIQPDGWMVRERGPQWGLKPEDAPGQRVAWHEMKMGVVFRIEDRARSESGRGMLIHKTYVAHRGEPHEFGRRLYAEALRQGLVQAKRVYVVADGGVWIWKLVEDRFGDANKLLDFYHASTHLWGIARELYGPGEKAQAWATPLLHQLRHGEHGKVLGQLQGLLDLLDGLPEASRENVRREVTYFQSHRDHLNYKEAATRGCPIGSGAIESANAQMQNRFKRSGQYWTLEGENCLLALDLARRNGGWHRLWACG